MTWVKICGTTNLEDAQTAVDAGADAVGFVFYEKSPRRIDLRHAHDIIEKLPSKTEKVGVFVDERDERISAIAQQVGLTAIQLHNYASPKHVTNGFTFSPRKLFVVLSVAQMFDRDGQFSRLGWRTGVKNPADAIFLDSGTRESPGGTGNVFDWAKAAPTALFIAQRFKLVIAGGLTALNVAEAIRVLKPWGVDVSSGVESRPGKKDPRKICAFIAAVQEAEQSA
jgi:phosphoribosylanthranilate isomerase